MKIKTVLSFAALVGLYAGDVAAQGPIPDINVSADDCHAWANTIADPNHVWFGHKRCSAIDTCMTEQSDNRENLHECLLETESTFQLETSTGLPSGRERGIETPATTETPDSDYYFPERPKGFDFADQGG